MRHDFIRLKIKEAMLQKNILNKEIAKILGTSEGNVSNILSGRSTTSQERLHVICSGVGVDLDAILKADLEHRLPGIQTVKAAWDALLTGETYEPCEILPEPLEGFVPIQELHLPNPEEKEAEKPIPAMNAQQIDVNIFVRLDKREIGLLVDALSSLLLNCVPLTPAQMEDLSNLERMHEVTSLMIRLRKAV